MSKVDPSGAYKAIPLCPSNNYLLISFHLSLMMGYVLSAHIFCTMIETITNIINLFLAAVPANHLNNSDGTRPGPTDDSASIWTAKDLDCGLDILF